MTLREIQEAVYQLSSQEQAKLLKTLMEAMKPNRDPNSEVQGSMVEDRHELLEQLRGCLKGTGQSEISDRDVETMRDERLVEKYL